MTSSHENNIVIFASGAGTNAQAIVRFFKKNGIARVSLVVCNNPRAGVLQVAAAEGIPVLVIEKERFRNTGYLSEIRAHDPKLIVLAGFLWMIPEPLIKAFPSGIVNIHPALLPAYGGKGMYGTAVHTAVVNAKERESGITIHYVDDQYDHGQIIFQAKCRLDDNETPESLAQKVHRLEHTYYPPVIAALLTGSPVTDVLPQ